MHLPSSPRRPAASAALLSAGVLRGLVVATLAVAGVGAAGIAQAQQGVTRSAAELHASRAFWQDIQAAPAARSPQGTEVAIRPFKYRAVTLNRASMVGLTAAAPQEDSPAARQNPLVLSLPDPAGGFQRFRLVEAPVMEPGLAARHPHIKTYAGRGIDDPTASVRISITQLGFQASVRSQKGTWYIDPYYQNDESLYVSYWTQDYPKRSFRRMEAPLGEPVVSLARGLYRAADQVDLRAAGFAPGANVSVSVRNVQQDTTARQFFSATATNDGVVRLNFKAEPYKTLGSYEVTVSDGQTSATTTYQVLRDGASINASTGSVRRSYRLAMVSDPAYATYFGGSANVTAAKVALVNRVTQIYEDETAIRLLLVANNDRLNLDTQAQFSQANGPCGATACYPTATVSCSSSVLTRTRQVIGLLIGASNFDVGHIGVGAGGGGIASLGVVGGNNKAQGCTGLPTPVGDVFAVDYVAHEIGHQFAGNHTFTGPGCGAGNRSAANSVEPGSGSSIMAYAGICGANDNVQTNSDPYWSQRSFDEIVTYVTAAETSINEVQQAALTGFTANGLQFQLRYNGNTSAPIVRGTNFDAASIKAAIEGIAGWPAGGTVTIASLTDAGFTITFGGTLAGVNASELEVVNMSATASGFIGEVAKGGLTTRGGSTTAATGNTPPSVSAPAQFTIPVRTPFALTASGSDADGDPVTYMWEQNDRGSTTGIALTNNAKTNGPLFRQFSKRSTAVANPITYAPPGQNAVTTNPTRVFPDLDQILANNTNAESGSCTLAGTTPTPAEIDCFSEYLPTAAYVGFAGVNAEPSLNFRVTARDGRGGVNSADTKLLLAAGAGPFLVTAPNTAVTWRGGSTQTVTWNVANTNVAPVNTANVRISLSIDGGLSYPTVLAASVPNNGSALVQLPVTFSTQARVRIDAVDNVYFDVSNSNFTILLPGDVNGDGPVDCADVAIVRANIGVTAFDPRADVNNDGRVDIRDLAFVQQRLPRNASCR